MLPKRAAMVEPDQVFWSREAIYRRSAASRGFLKKNGPEVSTDHLRLPEEWVFAA